MLIYPPAKGPLDAQVYTLYIWCLRFRLLCLLTCLLQGVALQVPIAIVEPGPVTLTLCGLFHSSMQQALLLVSGPKLA